MSSSTNTSVATHAPNVPAPRPGPVPVPVSAGRARSTSNASVSSTTSDDTFAGSVGSAKKLPNWIRSMSQKLGSQQPSDEPSSLGAGPSPSASMRSGGDAHSAAKLAAAQNPFDFGTSPPVESSLRSRFKRFSFSKDRDTPDLGRKSSRNRRPSAVPSSPRPPQNAEMQRGSSVDASDRGTHPCKLPELRGLCKKRVSFAAQVLANDPPQQIPPMNPKKGNVEFQTTGELSLCLKTRPKEFDFPPYLERNHRDLARVASQRASDQASKLHTSLTRPQLGLFSRFTSDEADEPVFVMGSARSGHDQALLYASNESESHTQDDESADNASVRPPTPEELYTRCCHLREIHPIKAMLKQLKDQSAPLTDVRIVNSRPTLIEVLAFADFITIVPVAFIILDGLELTAEMVRLILVAVSRSRHLSKLSFVNTHLDELAWKYLCAFLANSTSLINLDLACELHRTSRSSVNDRRAYDWDLFCRALEAKGSVDTLSVNGAKLSSDHLKRVLSAFRCGTCLELGSNNLDRADIECILDWLMEPDNKCTALNIGGNDLSQMWDLIQRLVSITRVRRLSLRDCQIVPPPNVSETFNIAMAEDSNLLVLDLSGNTQLMSSFMNILIELLPHFPQLVKLELARCSMTSDSIVQLCDAVVNCPQLGSLNVLDNAAMNDTAAAALCVAVHMSHTLCNVDVDTSNWPETLREQMTRYLLQNLSTVTATSSESTLIPDESSEQVISFKEDLQSLIADLANNKDETNTPAANHLVQKLLGIRQRVRGEMKVFLERKAERPLSLQERENLIRLYFIDGTIDRKLRQTCPNQNTAIVGVDEKINTMGISQGISQAPASLSRRSSQTSLHSLRQQEHEEGRFHKLNTYLFSYMYNGSENDDKDDLLDRLQDDTTTSNREQLMQRICKLCANDRGE